MTDWQNRSYPYVAPLELTAPDDTTHPVVVVGAGPVGLAAAIDLAQQGQRVILLDDDNRLSSGSRAICFSKRSLEIFDRLGCVTPMLDKGVRWQRGKVFLREDMIYQFDLQPEAGYKHPAFINLQQYYVEGFLVEQALAEPLIEIRWRNRVVGLSDAAGNTDGQAIDGRLFLEIQTPDGHYRLAANWVIACDGSRSPMRGLIGQESKGRMFRDRFLIADVRMKADFPTERWFWFDPPFHPNQSVLLHRQPDDVWRIDFQLGWEADPELEKQPDRVLPRIQALLGKDVQFDLEWVSVYTFSCLRMDRFRHGHLLFAGDSAHGVSPFGARGANSGIQDSENLAWKLARVIAGSAPESLLDTYDHERCAAADENILNSTRATDFITPKSTVSRVFRNAVLNLARDAPFARTLVNSGRLSVPACLHDSPLNTPDHEHFDGHLPPGSVAADAPISIDDTQGWLLDQLGRVPVLLIHDSDDLDPPALATWVGQLVTLDERARILLVIPGDAMAAQRRWRDRSPLPAGVSLLIDSQGHVAARYDLQPATAYLIRPDQHVAARTRRVSGDWLATAARRALGLELGVHS